ncbi:hypothetical protein LptCag_2144 [Leptospirillum ferriphilum]|uniref:Uncharacterized protein n=1 Tax=Leptospirillum ferriphilum TaxID=178606 RepID=A0A094X849_9BACT|nr:hypothetical protein LptCag_2144 [Leptospirillum ferriphilum]
MNDIETRPFFLSSKTSKRLFFERSGSVEHRLLRENDGLHRFS